jgi:hypothetical protein
MLADIYLPDSRHNRYAIRHAMPPISLDIFEFTPRSFRHAAGY